MEPVLSDYCCHFVSATCDQKAEAEQVLCSCKAQAVFRWYVLPHVLAYSSSTMALLTEILNDWQGLWMKPCGYIWDVFSVNLDLLLAGVYYFLLFKKWHVNITFTFFPSLSFFPLTFLRSCLRVFLKSCVMLIKIVGLLFNSCWIGFGV